MSVFELQTDHLIAAFDAGFQEEDLPVGTNPDGFDANGPNRFTIWVPSEHVIVNMGNPVRSGTVGLLNTYENVTDTVQVDGGFVAQTDHHIHFHTFGMPKAYDFLAPNTEAEEDENPSGLDKLFGGDEDKYAADEPKHDTLAQGRTVLRLGKPVKVVQAAARYGVEDKNQVQTPLYIGSGYSPAYNTWNGFAMVTEGGSYQESHGNNVIVSGKADLRLVGWRRAILSSAGDVHIGADMPSESLAALVGNAGTSTKPLDGNPGYTTDDRRTHADSKWPDQTMPWQVMNLVASGVSSALGIVTAAEAIAHLRYTRPPEEGKPGWKVAFRGSFGDMVGDGLGFAATAIPPVVAAALFVKSCVDAAKADNTPTGKVTLYASDSLTASGSSSATLHSDFSTSVNSLAITSISSNVSTSVGSLVAMSVSGLLTTMSGLASVGVSSQFGSASLRGKSSATVASWGNVLVSGNDDVQVNSMNKRVLVHGKAGFYVGCGAGEPIESWAGVTYPDSEGWGIVGDSASGLKLGKLKKATNFESPDVDRDKVIEMDESRLMLRHGGAMLSLEKGQVRVGNAADTKILIG